MMHVSLTQGTDEWLSWRKKGVGASDASIILGCNPWKTKLQLYHEKLSDENKTFNNQAMQRGVDLEPIARELFILKTGIYCEPRVVVHPEITWMYASLDGLSLCEKFIVEIKCPNASSHALAVSGKVPDHYYPQLQHQMYVAGVQLAYYFSFDGVDGVTVEVQRDDKFIEKMLVEERKFYDCLMNRTPPEHLCDASLLSFALLYLSSHVLSL